MRRNVLCLSFAYVLLLSACGGGSPKPKENALDKPVLAVNENGTGLVWSPISDATSYQISVNKQVVTNTTNTAYSFDSIPGNYNVEVVALGEEDLRSDAATFTYETKRSVIGDLLFDGTVVTWANSSVLGLEYQVDDGDYVTVEGDSLTVTASGIYTFRSLKGFNETSHIYYSNVVSKTLFISKKASANFTLEDGSAENNPMLNEEYSKLKYDGGWKYAASDVILDNSNYTYTEGKCVAFKYWYHGTYFMFEKKIKLDGSFNTFTFAVKSAEQTNFVLSFQVAHSIVINGIDLNGVYVKYEVSSVPTAWTRYTISLDDPAWRVNFNNTDYKFSDVASMISSLGVKVTSLSELFPFFDVFQFRLRGNYLDNGPSTVTYFDDVALLTEETPETRVEKIIPHIVLRPSYALKNDSVSGNLLVNDSDGALKVNLNDELKELDTELTVTEDNTVLWTSNEEGYDFSAVLSSEDGGNTLSLTSVSGTLAEDLEGLVLESVSLLEDFESYEDDGVGFDHNNPETNNGGDKRYIRGAYYYDWYNPGGSYKRSPIADSNWALMGSTDYAYLSKDVAHTGSQAMNFKSGTNAMRFLNWELYEGAEVGYSGKYFSFFAKGGDKGDMTLKVSVYSAAQLNSSNHVSNAVRKTGTFVLAKNSDWTEYRVELNPNETYYGFAFTTDLTQDQRNALEGTQRIYIDDIYIFNDMSPWGE